MDKMYLICLEGGGDEDIKLVGQETWKYINSDAPIFKSGGANEQIPAAVLAEYKKLRLENSKISYFVTIGSYDNDRALHVRGKDFDSIVKAFAWAKKKGIKIADEYHGCLY